MAIGFFDTHAFERKIFDELLKAHPLRNSIDYFSPRLCPETVSLAEGYEIVCSFANDVVNREVLTKLKRSGLELVALRSAGFNHVDIHAAAELGIQVVRVPAYSPHAVAEHALCLLLALNRKIHRAHARVRDFNFSLEGLVGFDLWGKTVGVIGTGKIGSTFAQICHGLGMSILAYDVVEQPELRQRLGVKYVPLDTLCMNADVISLHAPLMPSTHHIINQYAIAKMKRGVYLINTGRGGLIDTRALIEGLKDGIIGAAGLDVYEEEEALFFQDCSNEIVQDDVIARLMTFPNVLITSHQGFLTEEALHNIAATTLENIQEYEAGTTLTNSVIPNRAKLPVFPIANAVPLMN